jgi:hypothetical protein
MANGISKGWKDQQQENPIETARIEREKEEQARKQQEKESDPKKK